MDSIKGNLLYVNYEGSGLLFNKQSFFLVKLKTGQQELVLSVRPSFSKKIYSHSRLLSRLMRLEPRCAEQLDENRFVVCYQHKVWLLDTGKKYFSVLQESRTGFSNPLNLCSDGKYVYWGDYGDNVGREAVRVYRLSSDKIVDVVYEFPKGAIRHIHNVIWDITHRRFIVLTGDLEETSGIYVATEDWKEVKPMVTGRQQYRAVVGFPYGEGLIYATDSVSEENNIYLLQGGEAKPLCAFPGSCIYGTETKNYYVFASTVEPPEGRGILDMFSYKLGAGIRDRYSHLVTVRKSDLKVEEVLKVKKDIWPMKLFQYGVLTFPKGHNRSEGLWYNVIACKGDGCALHVGI